MTSGRESADLSRGNARNNRGNIFVLTTDHEVPVIHDIEIVNGGFLGQDGRDPVGLHILIGGKGVPLSLLPFAGVSRVVQLGVDDRRLTFKG